jgi:lipopolysaccharide export system protein LptC
MAKKYRSIYSFYVSLMKILLPIGIVFALGLAIGWPYITSLHKEKLIAIDATHPEIKENRMMRPHYISTDGKGQPFQVDADWAKQQSENENLADLTNPQGSMTMVEGETFSIKSEKGHYDSQEKTLTLERNVVLTSTNGDVIKTEKAHVDLDKGIISGKNPIEGKGETGEFKGEGFQVEKRPHGKKVITLTGGHSRVRVVINPKKKNKDSQGG